MLLRGDLPELRWRSLEAGSSDSGRCPRGVERLGVVPVEELASLHRTAACLVFPRLYDGLGCRRSKRWLPGVRSARRTLARFRGVLGAAVLFDPGDPAAIANGVREALALADELCDLGIAPRASRGRNGQGQRCRDRP